MPIFDITIPITSSLAPWPGDAPLAVDWTCRLHEGASVNLSAVSLSVHLGTHADAPYHFDEAGATIEQIEPAVYVGRARVVDVTGHGLIGPALLTDAAHAERLLLKTGTWRDHSRFPEQIPTLTEAAVAWLGEAGVRLIGLDVPSVDALDSKELPIHRALHARGIHILESLDLSAVAPGEYELIALPLRLAGLDGSPVRAVLRTR